MKKQSCGAQSVRAACTSLVAASALVQKRCTADEVLSTCGGGHGSFTGVGNIGKVHASGLVTSNVLNPLMFCVSSHLQAGEWEAAVATLRRALGHGGSISSVVGYYVAARLLAAAHKAAKPADAARLARVAAALPLEDAHRHAVVMAAVEHNMTAQNYG